jgi:hypothetical protein
MNLKLRKIDPMKAVSITGIVSAFCLGLIASAAPFSDYTWTPPTNYENGEVIDATDIITYNLYCGSASGGPYNFVAELPSGNSAGQVDVASCVGNTPGTYYFVLTAFSTLYATESPFSNEVSRTYTAADLGKVPNAPILLTVQ